MGILDGVALRRERAWLAKQELLEPGERLLDYEICRWLSRGVKAGVVLSDRALYVTPVRSSATWRIPIVEIMQVIYHDASASILTRKLDGSLVYPNLIVLRLWSGEPVDLLPIGKPREFAERLKASVPERLMNEVHLELASNGTGVTVSQFLPRPGEQGFHWVYDVDDGIDLNQEPCHGRFLAEFNELRKSAGDPPR